MKRIIIACTVIYMSISTGYCSTNYFPPLQSLGNDVTQDYNSSIASLPDPFTNTNQNSYPDVARIEQSLFGRAYANQPINSRLSRIEKSLFNATYPTSSDSQRIENIIMNFNQINKYPNISSNDLSRVEAQVFRHCYPQNNAQRRVERLEEQMFGAVQSGDLSARLDALKNASKTYNTSSDPAYALNQTGQGRLKSIGANILGGMLGNCGYGTMTGFTPPISPFYNNNLSNYNRYNRYNGLYNPYSPSLNAYSTGYNTNQGGNYTRTRVYDGTDDYNTGVGVHILD